MFDAVSLLLFSIIRLLMSIEIIATSCQRIRTSQLVSQSVSQSVERLTGHGSWRPPRLAVMCDPPGVVGVEPSVVLDLLHPRSAGSSSLALSLRPDVRFTA